MRETRVERAGARLWIGDQGAGPAVVMLHGGLASHEAVRSLVMPLVADHRVVTPDLRGSGRSRWIEPLSFDLWSDDLLATLDHLGIERAVIGGVSSGTGAALRFALRHPDRLDALALVRPIYQGAERGWTTAQREAFQPLGLLADRLLAGGLNAARPMYEALPEPARSAALALLPAWDPPSLATTARFLAAGAQPFAAWPELQRVTAPALVLAWDDPLHPQGVALDYSRWLPTARLVVVDGAGQPAALAAFCRTRAGRVPPGPAPASLDPPSPGRCSAEPGG